MICHGKKNMYKEENFFLLFSYTFRNRYPKWEINSVLWALRGNKYLDIYFG